MAADTATAQGQDCRPLAPPRSKILEFAHRLFLRSFWAMTRLLPCYLAEAPVVMRPRAPGAGDGLWGGTGDNQVLKSLGTRATLNDGTGNGEELDAFGGTSTINLNGGNTGELVYLAASGANTVNIGAGAGS